MTETLRLSRHWGEVLRVMYHFPEREVGVRGVGEWEEEEEEVLVGEVVLVTGEEYAEGKRRMIGDVILEVRQAGRIKKGA